MKGQSGFTLIERIMIITIISICAAIAVPQFVDISDTAQASNCKANQAAVEAVVSIIYAKNVAGGNAAFPTALADSMFKGQIPICPATGTAIGYMNTDGTAACPTSIAVHSRF